MQKPTRFGKVLLFGAAGLLFSGGAVRAAELGDNTRYYEDDAWYDVTEWMDGNDYNPTDEAWWRYDNETYQASKDVSGDSDSDRTYGYNTGNDNDWYYDYYNGYGDYYDYPNYYGATNYYDYDNDGWYDGYSSYTDWDRDGIYDDYNYYSFSDVGSNSKQQQQQQQNAQKQKQSMKSGAMALTGKIDKVKQVKVRGVDHTVVMVTPQDQQQGKSLVADLGKSSELKDLNLKQGDQITVKGPKSQIGDKSVVLARSIEAGGKTAQISRQGRQLQGEVTDTRKANVRGRENLIAMVEIQKKDQQKGGKIAVDLGPADKLKMDVKKGSDLTFTGVPVKVKDKRLVIAQSIQSGDQTVQIDRQFANQNEAQTAGQRTPADKQSTGNSSLTGNSSIQDWPQVAQKAAKEMKAKYGEPQGTTPTRLVWTNQGPFTEIILLNTSIDHDFPMPHKDCLEHVVNFNVPTDKVGELAKFDGSIIVDRTRGTLSARCDSEPHNLLALNLAWDIINGKKTVDEARQAYGQIAMKAKKQGEMDSYMKDLQFQPMPKAGDSDVPIVGPKAD